MPITTTKAFEDATMIVWHEDDQSGYHGERVEWKAGPQKNGADLSAAIRQAFTDTAARTGRIKAVQTALADARTALATASQHVTAARSSGATAAQGWGAGATAAQSRTAFLGLASATAALADAVTEMGNVVNALGTEVGDLAQATAEANATLLNLARLTVTDYSQPPAAIG